MEKIPELKRLSGAVFYNFYPLVFNNSSCLNRICLCVSVPLSEHFPPRRAACKCSVSFLFLGCMWQGRAKVWITGEAFFWRHI